MYYTIKEIISHLNKSKRYWIITQVLSVILQFAINYALAFSLELFYVGLTNKKNIILVLVSYLLLNIIFKIIMNYMEQYYMMNAQSMIKSDLYNEMLRAIDKSKEVILSSSKTLSDITQNVEIVADIISNNITYFISSIFLLILFLGLIFHIDIAFGLVYFIIFAISTLVHILFYSKMSEIKSKIQKDISFSNSNFNHMILGIPEIKIYECEQAYMKENQELNEQIKINQIIYEKNLAKHEFCNNFLYYLSEILPILLGIILLFFRQVGIGKIMFLIQFTQYLTIYMMDFSESFCQIKSSKKILEEVNEVLNSNEIDDVKKDFIVDSNNNILLELKNVSVSYDKKEIIKKCSLQCKNGDVIAIVGESGSGKTTLLNSIMQFTKYDGICSFWGKDAREFSRSSLRKYISYMAQNDVLVGISIFDNIHIGKLEADKAEVIDAARRANALEFIEELPNGFDTVLGENGENLSGGQIQRICIARALLRNAPIMLLDEPTSSLDSMNESEIISELANHNKGCIIMVTHRENTLKNVNKIIVLENGEIQAEGTYKQLYEESKYFREICLKNNQNHVNGEGITV